MFFHVSFEKRLFEVSRYLTIRGRNMKTHEEMVAEFELLDDEQLCEVLRSDTKFTESILLSIPDLASDAAFDLYGPEWLNRYWKRFIIEVKASTNDDAALKWAVNATAAGLSVMLTKHFNLPDVAIPASVALALLLIRAAKRKESKPKDKTLSSVSEEDKH